MSKLDVPATASPAQRRRPRWLLPAGVAAVLAATVAAGPLTRADASPALPPLSAADLLIKVRQADVPGLSGTVRERADLGLPKLPGADGSGTAGTAPLALLAGEHTIRVWYGGLQRARLALVDKFAESVLVRSGSDGWAYDSTRNTATHVRLPAAASAPDGSAPDSARSALTPQGAAERALSAIDPSTAVTVGRTAEVAGRPAYELVLEPRSATSLIGRVAVAVDSATGVPLRVQVAARGRADPAVEVGFTDVDFAVPPASRFAFTPPPGAKVTELQPPHGSDQTGTDQTGPEPTVLGTGWDSVVEMRGVSPDSVGDVAGSLLSAARPVSGAFGSGRLLSTALLSVLLTDDGRAFVGAVTPEALLATAGTRR